VQAAVAAVTAAERKRAAKRERLKGDFTYYAPNLLRIIDARGHVVPFALKPPQIRLALALQAQRESGEPMRATVLKARKVGFSTQAQGMLIQRATQNPHHHARVVAQDTTTAGEIFEMGRGMWERLPDLLRPPIAYENNSEKSKYIQWGEPSLSARRQGAGGLNSKLTIDTQKSSAGGRGMTVRSLHLSEVAFWEDKGKFLAMLNAVPDDEDTLVIVESTANGLNRFHEFWRATESGNGFFACFTPWFEENGYRRPFMNDEERGRFEERVGETMPGEMSCGEDEEPALVELMQERFAEWRAEGIHPLRELGAAGSTQEWTRILEHLQWRRWAIKAKCESDVEKFHQEYPSTPEEAFLSTGRPVFDRGQMRRLLTACRATPHVAEGMFSADEQHGGRTRTVATAMGTRRVPVDVVFVPKAKLDASSRTRARWRLWGDLESGMLVVPAAGRYVVAMDPESGEENEGQTAAHAIEVIDHRSLVQVAEWESDLHDADEAGQQALLAAIYFNRAWLAVESTGGWGLGILRTLARDVRYPMTYRRQAQDVAQAKEFDNRLGWSTDPVTKPLMRDRARELLRTGTDGIRSVDLVGEMFTYVMDERGRMTPEAGKRSDRLMAWMIAQMVAQEKRPRRDTAPAVTSTAPNAQQGVYSRESALRATVR
jgi:hypothetical protein